MLNHQTIRPDHVQEHSSIQVVVNIGGDCKVAFFSLICMGNLTFFSYNPELIVRMMIFLKFSKIERGL